MDAPEDLASLLLLPFDRLGVRYMATDGYAATLYGEPRLTTDVDVVAALLPRDVHGLHAAFDRPGFYVPPLLAELVDELGVRAQWDEVVGAR